ncbi:hypothetical protein D3H55_15395 [Bacillus salacetis]|uniref:Sporulation protein n=1 Tax=Bacillus salacetis TaxID=2315464 RepID=A0A3A1QVD6_9BACI|nr:sporulation protein [Bacillus salacetis]RIW31355.1 hypothetical protein D3H55_15395 [Bacillus salacetis]
MLPMINWKPMKVQVALEENKSGLAEAVSGIISINGGNKGEKVKSYEIELIGTDKSKVHVISSRVILCSRKCARKEKTEIPFSLNCPEGLPVHLSYTVRVIITMENEQPITREVPFNPGLSPR